MSTNALPVHLREQVVRSLTQVVLPQERSRMPTCMHAVQAEKRYGEVTEVLTGEERPLAQKQAVGQMVALFTVGVAQFV